MKSTPAAFSAAFDGLLDAETQEDAAVALKALRDATDGPGGLRLALYDAFEDEDRAVLDAVAEAAGTDAEAAAALLFA